jgi:carboxylesterase type B
MWTDGWFTGGFFESLKYRFDAAVPQLNNTYVYYFSHKSTASFSASTKFYGTSHVDDLIPLFSLRKLYFFSSMPTVHDMQLSKTMITLWINFATTGYVFVLAHAKVFILDNKISCFQFF